MPRIKNSRPMACLVFNVPVSPGKVRQPNEPARSGVNAISLSSPQVSAMHFAGQLEMKELQPTSFLCPGEMPCWVSPRGGNRNGKLICGEYRNSLESPQRHVGSEHHHTNKSHCHLARRVLTQLLVSLKHHLQKTNKNKRKKPSR